MNRWIALIVFALPLAGCAATNITYTWTAPTADTQGNPLPDPWLSHYEVESVRIIPGNPPTFARTSVSATTTNAVLEFARGAYESRVRAICLWDTTSAWSNVVGYTNTPPVLAPTNYRRKP